MSAPEQTGPQAAQPELGPGSKSAVRQYEAELEQKERAIRESIAAKISRIHEVERQLAALHNQLHVNVAPRKQALELLRHKIEEENRQIDVHRSAYSKAKAAMDAAAAALAAAEQRKGQLSEELTMLVMQSSGAQMRKLEQLSDELEHLTTGLPTTAAAANGTSHATASSSAAHGDATVQVAAAAASQQQILASNRGMAPNKTDAAVAGATALTVGPVVVKTGAVLGLKAVGFSSAGPVAGSAAASWMSATAVASGGAVQAGNVYATVQSFAMATPILGPVAPLVVGVGAGLYYLMRRRQG
ncbi:hypothetical protein C2E21_3803 [Chlorella sorokiniana]|uniref:Uncharacterized protein n=1 Tax=Chlorella sorokiniana TaxID=3076 RepID=A0A2P6TSE5_CHLSO|nr:hypothetical protein C2E21_3803 [Chlorella sorokiniana]|eukprot:PRW56976.1 hypothetical protein C2E21_3803 [Chlorella sorokiniana]